MYTPVALGIEQLLVNREVFRNFAESRVGTRAREWAPAPAREYDHTYCSECKIPLVTGVGTAECPNCHKIFEDAIAPTTHENASSSSIRKSTKGGKHKYYSVTSDYSKTQRKQILEQLLQCNNMYQGAKFSRDILQKVATIYNNIQKSNVPTEDAVDGAVGATNTANTIGTASKKFVRRGSIKDEILSALIFYECVRAGVARKKKDIAAMMRLPVNGFSDGDSIVRALHFRGVISIPVDTEPFVDFVDRYMEALSLDAHADALRIRTFVIDLVAASEREKIGMNSQLSSKIVGALWAAIVAFKLTITSTTLERAADNIKKSTFMKFYKSIAIERAVFEPIYARAGVAI